ncbi:hypothetical protein LJ739_05755 [Aestuariibacter halophilus]|uniref:Uncharacterized protein n=1 Tax=Fluctibacter halophilus TaxID=226011 RepID=A0ABS8G6N6_9ALTE|nr:hypothetical protein [Aestuariibacter halophilus]MCC2615741.1 hypothetical protein [Aestuariibacter halophilus]
MEPTQHDTANAPITPEHQAVMEKAAYNATTELDYGKPGLPSIVFGHFVTIFIALVGPYIIGYSLVVNGLFLGLGLIFSGYMTDWLDKRLNDQRMKRSLDQVLSAQQSDA